MAKIYIRDLGVFAEIDSGSGSQPPVTLPDIPELINQEAGNNQFEPYELWLKIGQSNSVGTDGSGPILFDTLDAPDPRLFELSRGIDKNGRYYAAPAGELMKYQVPAQDDSAGIGFGLHFGKTRLRMNPGIKQLVIVNRGVGGTGFSGNRWNPGDDLYTAAVNDVNLALANYPHLKFMGFIWHQGESDAGQGQAFYESALGAMVQGMRNDILGASDQSVFIAGTMVESWIAANETDRRPIDDAHRNISNYITNSNFADFSDLTDLQDSIHFGTGSLRTMGERYAYDVQDTLATANISPYKSHLFEVVNGKFVDVWNGGNVYGTHTIVNDGTRGDVLSSNGLQGYRTDLSMNPASFTKFGWVNVNVAPSSYGNFISGFQVGGSIAQSHYWGWNGFGNGGTNPNQNRGLSNDLVPGTWAHVALSFNGTEFRYYLNGVLTETTSINANIIPAPAMVELATFSGIGANALDCLMDKIGILPFAVSDAGAAELMNL